MEVPCGARHYGCVQISQPTIQRHNALEFLCKSHYQSLEWEKGPESEYIYGGDKTSNLQRDRGRAIPRMSLLTTQSNSCDRLADHPGDLRNRCHTHDTHCDCGLLLPRALGPANLRMLVLDCFIATNQSDHQWTGAYGTIIRKRDNRTVGQYHWTCTACRLP